VSIWTHAGGLCWSCAHAYSEAYLQGDYTPSVMTFQEIVTYLWAVLAWDLLVVFDGIEPKWKKNELERRYGQDDSNDDSAPKIQSTGTYISLCAKVCFHLRIPYVVGRLEADMHVVRSRRKENPVVVTGDADILAYDDRLKIVFVTS